jgi:hypothetical protein
MIFCFLLHDTILIVTANGSLLVLKIVIDSAGSSSIRLAWYDLPPQDNDSGYEAITIGRIPTTGTDNSIF